MYVPKVTKKEIELVPIRVNHKNMLYEKENYCINTTRILYMYFVF